MKAVEEYIEEYTKNCSNEYLTDSKPNGLGGYISCRKFTPWLTPEHARSVAEIAREETIKEVCEWLDSHTILSEKWYIEDLKKHFS